ncbi:MAG: chloride channel protein, partial [Candidatus Hydrogenedentes bacterium]|nr:chloride channel protein [Candidatus Hydrogenedentota bacterium]
GIGRLLKKWVRVLKFSRRDLRQTTICGAAAGVAAVLGTPLGAGIFAVELLSSHEIEYDYLFPAIVASGIGAVSGRLCGVTRPDWPTLTGAVARTDMLFMLICFVVVAVVTGLLGICFVLAYKTVTEFRARMPYWLGPIVGAAICVVCAVGIRRDGILGSGAPMLQTLLDHPAGLSMLVCLLLAIGKSTATLATIGGGANAGLTTPLLVVGGLMGGAFVHMAGLDGVAAQSLAVCGAAAMLAAVLNVPIAAAIICIELFGAAAAVPAALGSVIGFAVAKTEVVYSYSTK